MTTATMDIMERVESLPIDMKIELVDKILESLTPNQKEIDELWKIEVERRIDDLESGKAKTIPGEQVFANIRKRYEK
ncbi:MAG: addiction module protein [Chloracidobacterium sp.]|nr:addiction module protein [Chloracidobacterium sp.]